MSFAALATGFGLEAILGAFGAGATISLLDRDRALTHQQFRTKLQAVGFGALIPFFFVATGMSLDVRSFVINPGTLARVPVSSPRSSSPAACPHCSTARCFPRGARWSPRGCSRRRT